MPTTIQKPNFAFEKKAREKIIHLNKILIVGVLGYYYQNEFSFGILIIVRQVDIIQRIQLVYELELSW